MVRYREPTKKPCSACPFRRKAAAGWLGAGSPESFIDCINREEALPCHQTLDYDDRRWKEKWLAGETGNTCAGALIMSANMAKSPRDRSFPRMAPDRVTVFERPMEFVQYHRASKGQSWDDDEQLPQVQQLKKTFEQTADMLKQHKGRARR